MSAWEEEDRVEARLREAWHRYGDWMLALLDETDPLTSGPVSARPEDLQLGAAGLVRAIEAAEAREVALDDQRRAVKRRWADCPYPRPKTRCCDVPSERGRPVDWTRHTKAHAEAYRAAHLAWAAAAAEHRQLLAAGGRWLRPRSAHLN